MALCDGPKSKITCFCVQYSDTIINLLRNILRVLVCWCFSACLLFLHGFLVYLDPTQKQWRFKVLPIVSSPLDSPQMNQLDSTRSRPQPRCLPSGSIQVNMPRMYMCMRTPVYIYITYIHTYIHTWRCIYL